MRVGSLGDPLPMVILLFGASMMGIQTFGVSQAMTQEVVESVEDLERVGEAKQSFDLHFHEFLRQAAEHSLHQTSNELGETGGGSTWGYDDIFGTVRYTELWERFRDTSARYLNEEYDLSAATDECEIPGQDYEITPFSQPEPDIRYSVTNPNRQEVNCVFGGENVQYRGEEESFQSNGNATDNRYLQMAYTASYLFEKLKGNLTQVKEEYVAQSDRVCGRSSIDESLHRQAERRVEQKVSSAITSEKNEAAEPFPKFEGLEITEFVSLGTQQLRHGTETGNFCLTDSCTGSASAPEQTHNEVNTNNQCDRTCVDYDTVERCYMLPDPDDQGREERCFEVPVCDNYVIKYDWYVEERVEPLSTSFDWEVMPEENSNGIRERIPTENGWRVLNFELTYDHNYQSD